MSCQTIYYVKQATAARFQDHLELYGDSVDLSAVMFVMRKRDSSETVVINAAGTVEQTGSSQDKTLPNVEFQATELQMTLDVGDYDAEWQCTFTGGQTDILPRNGYHRIRVVERLV